jgi:hypothetical protein
VARSEIRLWRGLVKCELYAAVYGSEEAFAVSDPFRLRDADVPSAHAQHALAGLLAELERGGWNVVAHGSTWYEHTLELLPSASAEPQEADDDEDVLPRVIYRSVPTEDEQDVGGS